MVLKVAPYVQLDTSAPSNAWFKGISFVAAAFDDVIISQSELF